VTTEEGRSTGRAKSSSQYKGEGALDKAKGKAKEATGAVTGDEAKKSEGRSDQAIPLLPTSDTRMGTRPSMPH
jgi:hypothetical protein